MKLPHRRHVLHLAAGAAVLPALSRIARAQAYPARPITLVVPFAAGGAFDVIARVITPTLSEVLHQQVVVENVGAAAGIVGTNRVAHATSDGYSMLLGTVGTHAYNPALYKKLPYNPASDFAPVGLVAEQPLVLIARKDFPANTLPEFIAYTKQTTPNCNMARRVSARRPIWPARCSMPRPASTSLTFPIAAPDQQWAT